MAVDAVYRPGRIPIMYRRPRPRVVSSDDELEVTTSVGRPRKRLRRVHPSDSSDEDEVQGNAVSPPRQRRALRRSNSADKGAAVVAAPQRMQPARRARQPWATRVHPVGHDDSVDKGTARWPLQQLSRDRRLALINAKYRRPPGKRKLALDDDDVLVDDDDFLVDDDAPLELASTDDGLEDDDDEDGSTAHGRAGQAATRADHEGRHLHRQLMNVQPQKTAPMQRGLKAQAKWLRGYLLTTVGQGEGAAWLHKLPKIVHLDPGHGNHVGTCDVCHHTRTLSWQIAVRTGGKCKYYHAGWWCRKRLNASWLLDKELRRRKVNLKKLRRRFAQGMTVLSTPYVMGE